LEIFQLSYFQKIDILEQSTVLRIQNFRVFEFLSNRMYRQSRIFEWLNVSKIRSFREIIYFKKSTVLTRKLLEINLFSNNRDFRSSRFFSNFQTPNFRNYYHAFFLNSLSYRCIFHLIFGIRHGRCIHRTRLGWNRFDQRDSRGHQSRIRRYLHNPDH